MHLLNLKQIKDNHTADSFIFPEDLVWWYSFDSKFTSEKYE